jgi:hypothetical protein
MARRAPRRRPSRRPHRAITDDHDLTDLAEAREHDQRTARRHDPDGPRAAAQRSGAEVEQEASADFGEDTEARARTFSDNAPDAARTAGEPTDAEPVETVRSGGAGRTVLETEPGPSPRDVRQQAADEPARDDGHDPDTVRVPSTSETAESVRRAHRALAELKQRQANDDRRALEEVRERDDELARWHTDDHAADGHEDRGRDEHHDDAAADRADHTTHRTAPVDEPVLEVSGPDGY